MRHELMPFSGVPLVAGTVTGVRSFGVHPTGILYAPCHSDFSWTPGENLATCRGRYALRMEYYGIDGFTHKPGTLDCTCGFYAYFDYAYSEWARYDRIDALIEGYGRVTMGTQGFRCEKAKIVALIDPTDPQDPKPWYDLLADRFYDNGHLWAGFFAAVTIASMAFATISLWFILLTVASLAMIGLVFRSISIHDFERDLLSVPYSYWENVRKRYPKVPVFSSLAEAVKEFPLTQQD